ncbi:MAG: serine hydrolase [Candidatus Rokuibacteriota bacterium]|nr:MAG: serine hydrolase [Candidatus Rokubacteria bacterium]
MATTILSLVSYVPTAREWAAKPPAELGLREDGLRAAMQWHRGHESTWPRDFITESGRFIGVADEPAESQVLGPVRPRKDLDGVILRAGYLVAEWGDTQRADMSFSIAKSYLAVLAGIAVTRGLIRDLDEPVAATAIDDDFASDQNRRITWRHLLEQTSEWQGTVWDKPDSIDHNRDLRQSDLGGSQKGQPRPLKPPGTLWEYNDVRVNRLSLSLLQRFRRALPDVLREAVMDPIGASAEWQWHPYRNSWIELDGRRLPSVPGGSHWGGGLWMSTRDHARFALLVHRRGAWGRRQLLDQRGLAEMRRPGTVNPQYGLLWWLNTGRGQFPSAPESSYAARGAGTSVIWIDPEHDLIAVVRWIDKPALDGFIRLVLESVK